MGNSVRLVNDKYINSGLIINKAIFLKPKYGTNIINQNKKTLNNSSVLLNNTMYNKVESRGRTIVYSLKN